MLFKTVYSRQEVQDEMKVRGMTKQCTKTSYGGRTVSYRCPKDIRLPQSQESSTKSRKCRVFIYSIEDDNGAFHLYNNPSIPHVHVAVGGEYLSDLVTSHKMIF